MDTTATRLGMGFMDPTTPEGRAYWASRREREEHAERAERRKAFAKHLQDAIDLIAQGRTNIGIYRNTPGFWRETEELDDADDRFHEAIDLLGLLIRGLRGGCVMSGPAWLGVYDPDTKKPVVRKLRHAADRYTEKTGRTAKHCLCSPVDAEFLQDVEGITVNGRAYISRHVFYVGEVPA